MAKYSFEFKKKVVLEYLDGKVGTEYLSKKYGQIKLLISNLYIYIFYNKTSWLLSYTLVL